LIGDLLSDAAIFLKGVKVLNAILSPIEHFSFMSIVVAIPLAAMDTVYLNLDDSEVTQRSHPNFFIRRLRVGNKFLERPKTCFRRNFHIFVSLEGNLLCRFSI